MTPPTSSPLSGKHRSIWQGGEGASEADPAAYTPLGGDASADVVVIGGGITGLTAAVLLKRAGKRVILLERDRLGAGVSGFTSAHLSLALDYYYHRVADNFGREGARLLAGAAQAAVDRIERFVREDGIACDFRRVDGYLYAEPGMAADKVADEVKAAAEAGLAVARVDPAAVPLPFAVAAAARFTGNAQFHPLRYLHGLAALVHGDGSRVCEGTRVTHSEEGQPCHVVTEHGTVTASAVLECTHVPLHGLMSLHPRVYPYRSYLLALRLADAPPEGLFWDVAEPYHYTRRVDAPDGPLLLVGGADHKTGHTSHTEDRFRQVEAYARERYAVTSVAYHWSGQVFESPDHLPYIGRIPGHQHLYTGTGYAGDGLVYGTVAGLVLTDLVQGRDNPWAELFSPARIKPFASAPRTLRENLDVAYHWLADRLFAATEGKMNKMAPNEGLLVEVDGHQLAVYRDPDGALHALSPTCTHARCIVQWNAAEHTWDCPCHGGRFDAYGTVLNGPPVQDLQRVPLRRVERT